MLTVLAIESAIYIYLNIKMLHQWVSIIMYSCDSKKDKGGGAEVKQSWKTINNWYNVLKLKQIVEGKVSNQIVYEIDGKST